jgi:hypothetical protein
LSKRIMFTGGSGKAGKQLVQYHSGVDRHFCRRLPGSCALGWIDLFS